MTKTMSIRMDKENYDFLSALSKAERGDLSKAVRDLVFRGRLMLAIENYRNGNASLGKAAELAGVPIGKMIGILSDYGIESNLEKEDYRQEFLLQQMNPSPSISWPLPAYKTQLR